MNDTLIIIAVFTALAVAFAAIMFQLLKDYMILANDRFNLHSKRMDDIENMLSHLSNRVDDIEADLGDDWEESYDDYDDPDYSREFEYDDDI